MADIDVKDNRELFFKKEANKEVGKDKEEGDYCNDVSVSESKSKPKVVMTIAPMNKRITVRIAAPMEKTKGGIVIPESVQDKEAPTHGAVMGIAGDCSERTKRCIKVGMVVIFSKYAGVDIQPADWDIKDNAHRYQILKEDDVLACLVRGDDLADYIYIEDEGDNKEHHDEIEDT